MTYEYTISSREFNAAQKLYLRHKPWAKFFLYFSYVFWPLMSLFALSGQIRNLRQQEEPVTLITVFPSVAPVLIFVVLVVVFRRLNLRRTFRALLPKGETVSTTATFSFDDQSMEIAVPGKSARYFWSSIVDFAEDEKMVLIFPQKNLFNLIPKDAVPADQWERVRHLLPAEIKRT